MKVKDQYIPYNSNYRMVIITRDEDTKLEYQHRQRGKWYTLAVDYVDRLELTVLLDEIGKRQKELYRLTRKNNTDSTAEKIEEITNEILRGQQMYKRALDEFTIRLVNTTIKLREEMV